MGLISLIGNPMVFVFAAISLVLAITVHEFAHAWMAHRLGDPTPEADGRLTLNPLAHLDPIGTIMIVMVGFGWGRPVVFSPHHLTHPVRDTALIAFAGPLSNLILATLFSIILFITFAVAPQTASALAALPMYIIAVNVMLAIFNLVPIHPLDGGKILSAFLPDQAAVEYDRFLYRYGFFVLIFLIMPIGGRSALSALIGPPIDIVTGLIMNIGQLVATLIFG